MRVIHEKCDPKLAEDRQLPYTAYLIQYEVEGKIEHDIAMGSRAVDIFDHYYDKYKNVQGIAWTNGIVSPRTIGNQPTLEEKPKRKRKK